MSRLWFYVVDTSTDWEVRETGGTLLGKGQRYIAQEDAVHAAIQLGRAEWRLNREPTGVRVQSLAGNWHDVTRIGERGVGDAAT